MNKFLDFAKNELTQNFQDIKNEATNIVKTTAQKTMDDVKNAAGNTITNVTNPMLHSTNTESSSGANPSSAPAAPQAPSNTSTNTSSLPVSQSVNNNNNLPSSSSSISPSTESGSKDIVGDLKHSIFSDQELNILKLMEINHLKPDKGEDIVNGDILGVLTTALNNQLTTKDAELIIKNMIVERIPKIAEKIANFDNNTLAELIFKKTMDSIDFKKHLIESLQEAASKNRKITSIELLDILIRRIMYSGSDQNGKGIEKSTSHNVTVNTYPFKSRVSSKTRSRLRVRII